MITNNYSGVTLPNKIYKQLERKAFYDGTPTALIRFYKNRNIESNIVGTNDHKFWRIAIKNAEYKIPLLHLSLPNMITKAISTLTFSESPIFGVETGSEENDIKYREVLEDIWESNNKDELLQEAAEKLSYSGSIGIKVVIDPEFSDLPILQVYPGEDIDVVKRYGSIVSEIQFKDYYTKEVTSDDKYNDNGLSETIGSNANYVLRSYYGYGYIKYRLFRLDAEYNEREVKLNTLPELADLKDVVLPNKKMFGVYMENKTGAKSDYDHCIDEFNAIDEVYSNMMNYIRKSKIKVYLPESACEKTEDGLLIIPNEYDNDNIIVYDSERGQDKLMDVKRDVIDIEGSINGYKVTLNEYIQNALRSTGLSPTTLTISETGINASGVALENRENPSMRTRAEKNKRWNNTLKKLNKLLLEIYLNKAELDYDFLVDFAEYSRPTVEAITSLLTQQLDAKLISQDEALKVLWGDSKSEDEIEIMKLEIEKDQTYVSEDLTKDDEVIDFNSEIDENDDEDLNEVK